ncbi:hypothetical protein EPUL_001707 [Erysiphe pulchra]|uniref:AMP-activated protein kinase glycogen-binding domain-containing protein n=1 Tax=Erysiphe pulchra TaxID=225359 RepID=A0A2S4PWQ7_9PEZI|nr:hypothetical protein EPUL_001707 [Erysiphe pulchra]
MADCATDFDHREHPADEVYVTGSFDDWSKSERLDKKNNVFTKEVILPIASDKIYYKFVVDGNWVTDHTAPQENDESGNLNNVLTVDKINIFPPESVGTMSGVTADSTTISLAGAVPLAKDLKYDSATLPGTFPVSPDVVERNECEFMTKPASIPGSLNIPAATDEESPSSAVDSSNDVQTKTDKKIKVEEVYSISPLPAFPGAVNPISIAPGEKLPDYSTLTSNTLVSSVDLNDDKYRQCDQFTDTHPVTNSASNLRDTNDVHKKVSSFVSETPKDTDPVSILPIQSEIAKNLSNSPFIQSVGPQSTTATLASGVPITSDLKHPLEKAHKIDSHSSPESGVLESENEHKSKSLDQATAESCDTKIPNSSKTESKLIKSSSELFSTTENTPEIIKEPIFDLEQSLEASKIQEAISPEKEIEKELPTEEKLKPPIEDSTSSAAPQNSVEPTHTQATPQCITTIGEATSTDEKNITSGPAQDTGPCTSSILNQSDTVNNESTVNDKSGKKKKRLSIFGKIKAKLTSKDKD